MSRRADSFTICTGQPHCMRLRFPAAPLGSGPGRKVWPAFVVSPVDRNPALRGWKPLSGRPAIMAEGGDALSLLRSLHRYCDLLEGGPACAASRWPCSLPRSFSLALPASPLRDAQGLLRRPQGRQHWTGMPRSRWPTPGYNLDISFPLGYPDQKSVADYITQKRDEFLNVAKSSAPRDQPYQLTITSTNYGSAIPPRGTEAVVFKVYENIGGAHPRRRSSRSTGTRAIARRLFGRRRRTTRTTHRCGVSTIR